MINLDRKLYDKKFFTVLDEMDPYKNLANAIIFYAVQDYGISYLELKSQQIKQNIDSDKIIKLRKRLYTLEKEFNSQWFNILSYGKINLIGILDQVKNSVDNYIDEDMKVG